ncbi:RHS repeat-associated core domain-containing protein [Pseudomonas sp. S37]|uniref:RHS repeat-associated core domain-containing protein n=1 Tax=Pseudomonas sp. S37 TaxID=2767449 RepID=UPI0019129C65|nr:RHS repeat-associated core domain-containing protein [Pseudomonas sp. S37]MBK4993826.1 RHS repeat-associated core domain-containing protein [Pseudomonas sp. S37]
MSNKRKAYLDDNLVVQTGANKPRAYTAYGYGPDMTGETVSGFNGQLLDRVTRGYHLGQGKRLYSPALGRFLSPDPLSPWDSGGMNGYMYCVGDPANFIDPSGLSRIWYKPSPPAYSPRRRFSEPSNMPYYRKAVTRSDSLPKAWKDRETLPTFHESRHLDPDRVDAVRYSSNTQRNKVLPTYAQATDPEGLAKYRFKDDFSGTGHLQSRQLIDSDVEQSRLGIMLRSVDTFRKSTLGTFLQTAAGAAIIITALYFAAEELKKVRQ